MERCIYEYDSSLLPNTVQDERPNLDRVDVCVSVNDIPRVLQQTKSPIVMNAVGALLPRIGVRLKWEQGGTLLSKVFLKVTSFLFISNQPFNKDPGRRIPRPEKVRVALFDLPQSLDRVPSDEG